MKRAPNNQNLGFVTFTSIAERYLNYWSIPRK